LISGKGPPGEIDRQEPEAAGSGAGDRFPRLLWVVPSMDSGSPFWPEQKD
jgi:hypothetical protein